MRPAPRGQDRLKEAAKLGFSVAIVPKANAPKKPIEGLTPEAQQVLMSYGWPGNVRELRTAIERMVVLSSGPKLGVESLPPEIRPSTGEAATGMNNLVGISIVKAEKELIRNTLKLVNGNREQAAKILKISERKLYRKIKEYDL